ncbi:MAG: hypothetical protein HYZ50_18170 [Deltaproteobacteria bacterium]|nr:hypothetical protein [Deltaproteobacteria bacterium]
MEKRILTPKGWSLLLSLSAALVFTFAPNVQASKIGGPNDDYDGDGLTNAQEKVLKTNPKKADTDKDGLSDGVEVNDTHTDPRRKDSDRDHLTDSQELALHTDPLDDDSDDDGVEDGDEVDDGTDPLDADTDDDGIDDGDDPEPGEHGAEFEVRGQVTAVDSSAGCLLTITTQTGPVQVDASTATIEGGVACDDLNGEQVEAEGFLVKGVLQAEKVNIEDGQNDEDDEVEIRGQVTGVDTKGGCFLTVNTTAGVVPVDASTARIRGAASCAALNGQLVEAEGVMVGGVLKARDVKVEDD